MNLFEDLVVELKEENLLESTFVDRPSDSISDDSADDAVLSSEEIHGADEPSTRRSPDETASQVGPDGTRSESRLDERHSAPAQAESAGEANPKAELLPNSEAVEAEKKVSDSEFFKKRAASEMSSLKMVDAILSAVERESLKVMPKTYDDLNAQKALHAYMQMSANVAGDERKQAEFDLHRETELWCSALAVRDESIMIGHLRVYSETCRPMLSSQAMLALARFYRNLPYGEGVRAKFDFIITRLFSRPTDNDKRQLLFSAKEMLGHIQTLYRDWSSVPLYSTEEDDSNILLTAISFDELASEAESASSFDDLIRSDFFGRLRLFKESISELFFAPAATAAAIECNIRVGNVYIDLRNLARREMDLDSIQSRFSGLNDQTVSEAAGRSLGLFDILQHNSQVPNAERNKVEGNNPVAKVESPHDDQQTAERRPPEVKLSNENSIGNRFLRSLRSVNKTVLVLSLLMILVSVGIYVWGNYYSEVKVANSGVKSLSFQGTDLGDHVKIARLSGDTLYIVAHPAFNSLSKEKQVDELLHFYQAGKVKGWSKVNLMNDEGRTIGFASSARLEIY